MAKWTEETITSTIKSLHENGECLASSSARKNHYGLFQAAIRKIGSWRSALSASGLNPDEHRKLKRWDKEKVIDEIKRIYQEDGDVSSVFIAETKGYHSLYQTAIKLFGGYEEAIKAAGLNPEEVYRKKHVWDEEELKRKVREIYKESGQSSYKYFYQHYPSLVSVCQKRFGSWYNTLNLIDIETTGIRTHWSSEQQVIDGIRSIEISGNSLAQSKVPNNLYLKGRRIFGSWEKSLEAAGVDIHEHKLYNEWSKDELITRIKQHHTKGHSMLHASIMSIDSALASSYLRYYDNWHEFLRDAGIKTFNFNQMTFNQKMRRGFEFQFLVREVFNTLEIKCDYEKSVGKYRPDFILNKRTWIDAKLSSWTAFVDKTLVKYQNIDTLIIVYLRGSEIPQKGKRFFIPIEDFFPTLREKGEFELIRQIEELRNRVEIIESA